MLNNMTIPLSSFYTACYAVGGIMGYKKKRSKDSLIASSIIAGLMLVSAFLMGRPDTTYGVRLALGEQPLIFSVHVAELGCRVLPQGIW